jgi:hypothetical protein
MSSRQVNCGRHMSLVHPPSHQWTRDVSDITRCRNDSAVKKEEHDSGFRRCVSWRDNTYYFEDPVGRTYLVSIFLLRSRSRSASLGQNTRRSSWGFACYLSC